LTVFWLTVFLPRISASSHPTGAENADRRSTQESEIEGQNVQSTDRDGVYALVKRRAPSSTGATIDCMGDARRTRLADTPATGITLAQARDRCIEARRASKDGHSLAQEKQRDKRRLLCSLILSPGVRPVDETGGIVVSDCRRRAKEPAEFT
jgi:hypothetical protein